MAQEGSTDNTKSTAAAANSSNARTKNRNDVHSWIKQLRGEPGVTSAASTHFHVATMATEEEGRKVFENIRNNLRRDMDGVETMASTSASMFVDKTPRADVHSDNQNKIQVVNQETKCDKVLNILQNLSP